MPKRSQISQTEARRLRAENEQLRDQMRQQRSAWRCDYPGGVNIASLDYASATDFIPAVVHNSRRLGHAVVCIADGKRILFYALPLPEVA